MKNFIQPGDMMEITAAAALSSGDGVLQGSVFGVAAIDVAIGEKVNIALEGVYELPKKSADVFAQGAKAYWDNTLKEVTVTAMGNSLIGVAHAAAGAGILKISVRLDGTSI